MDIFCFWSQGWFDSIPGLKFWCCYYVSRWEKDEEQKERRRRDVWYEFLLRRTVISKPVGERDLWWNLQDIHKEWYLCMREVALWSLSGVDDKMPTRCYKSKRKGRGRRTYFIFSSKCFDVFVWSMSEILEIASSCQERNVKSDGGGERTGRWWKLEFLERNCVCGIFVHADFLYRVWTWECDGWFFFLCPGKTIPNSLGCEHLEGISIPVESKLAPDGWTKPRSRGCESKVGDGAPMWTQKDQWITSEHFVSLLTVQLLRGMRAAVSFFF